MVRLTGEGTPFTGHVIERGFSVAQAFVVVMTPDDEARLHADLHDLDEPDHERELTCQPRPNVLFEAGMAFGASAKRTILVHVGHLRPISDLAGRNVVVLGSTKAPLKALADRLEGAGCPVDRSSPEVFEPTRFGNLPSLSRRARTSPGVAERATPTGRVIAPTRRAPAPRLAIRLHERGTSDHLLEIANRGGVSLRKVEWELVGNPPNWHLLTQVLPEYPVATLDPQQYVRVPVAISMGGPVYVDLIVRARTDAGEAYTTTARLSVYG